MGRHALLLAASTFPADSGLEDLPGARRDVDQLKAVLDEAGQFDSVAVHVDLRRHEMVAEIEQFYQERRRGDLALLYYSGHGLLADDADSLFFATSESTTRGSLHATFVDADGVLRHCLNATNASQRVVLLDCCFSGAFELRNRFRGGVRQEPRRGVREHGTFVLAASNHLRAAKSQGPDRPSIFTAAVLDALRGPGTTNDEQTWVTTSDLARHVHQALGRFSPTESSEGVTDPIKLVEVAPPQGESATPRPAPVRDARADADLDADQWRRLVDYYMRCLRRGAELGSFVQMKARDTYVAADAGPESVLSGSPDQQLGHPAYATFARRLSGSDQQIRYGYPVLVLSGGKDGKERRFAPLLVSDVMVTEKGTVLANPPGFNRAIGSELRLAEPELDDLSRQVDETLVAGDRLSLTQTVRRLMDVLGLKSAGTIDPSRLSGAVTPGPVDRVQNAAVLFAADASEGIQAGLLADLDDIRKSPNKIDSSALGALAEIPGTGEDPPDEVRIVTPDRLNESQEQVIRSAMTQRLTVAQGPPGTGKSQLVAALVATATAAGHSVLVGSTNNRAVDEVVERIRRTSAPGLLIRTGSREYRAAEPALLRELMTSASNVPADEETPTADVRILQQEIAELRHALDRRRRCERDLADLAAERAQLEALDRPDAELARMIGWAERMARGGLFAWWWRRRLRSAGWHEQEGLDDLVFRLTVEGRWRSVRQEIAGLPEEVAVWRRLTELIGDDRPQASRRLLNAQVINRVRSGRKALDARITQMSQPQPRTWVRFPELLRTLPAWATTALSARGLPPNPGLFDLVIIDEAAQCSVPQVLPMLYRARRALVIGDPHQLAPVVTLPGSEDKTIQQKAGLSTEWLIDRQLTYSGYSAYEAFAPAAGGIFLLDEHYRCRPEIIAAPNRAVYQNQLAILTAPDVLGGASVTWRHVTGSFHHGGSGSGTNPAEVQAVVDEVRRLRDAHPNASIGVVTPLAAQSRTLDRALDVVRRQTSDIICGTIHRYQGGEQDIMVVSPVGAGGIRRPTQNWLVNQTNLWNVAITRARSRLIVVGDQDWWSGQRGLLPELLRPDAEAASDVGPGEAIDRLHREFRQAGVEIARAQIVDGRRYDVVVAGKVLLRVDDPAGDADGRALRKLLASMDLRPRGSDLIRVPVWRCLAEPDLVVQEVLARLA